MHGERVNTPTAERAGPQNVRQEKISFGASLSTFAHRSRSKMRERLPNSGGDCDHTSTGARNTRRPSTAPQHGVRQQPACSESAKTTFSLSGSRGGCAGPNAQTTTHTRRQCYQKDLIGRTGLEGTTVRCGPCHPSLKECSISSLDPIPSRGRSHARSTEPKN